MEVRMGHLRNASDVGLQKTRAWAGLLVVVLGDAAITIAAIWGVAGAGSAPTAAVLTSAFTAVSTMTTAYFGIRAATNTAQAHTAATAAQADRTVTGKSGPGGPGASGGPGAEQGRPDRPAEGESPGP